MARHPDTGPAASGDRAPARVRRTLLAVSIGALAGLVATYLVALVIRSNELYDSARERPRTPYLSAVHPDLGFASVPLTGTSELASFDRLGFRVPLNQKDRDEPLPEPRMLFLGDSFTYGYLLTPGETFPVRAAESLGGTALNAGMGSYGLAQMLVQAREWIPELKPDYVVVQYSPLIVGRATIRFAQMRGALVPVPYMTDADGAVSVAPPVFESVNFDLPMWEYGRAEGGWASFFVRVGLPLLVHDDFNVAALRIKSSLGHVPPPLADRQEIVDSVYGEIADLCRRSGAQFVLFVIDVGPDRSDFEDLAGIEADIVVDAHSALLDSLTLGKRSAMDWHRAYSHWKDGELGDQHPNDFANEVMGNVLARAILAHEVARSGR